MIKIDEIERFEKEAFPQIMHQYWELNNQVFPTKMDEFVPYARSYFEDFFKQLGEALEKKNCEVGEITVSLIRYSFREETQRARVEAFDSREPDKKLICAGQMDISWLFSTWQDLREMIETEIKKQMLSSIVSESYVTYLMEKTITNLVMVLYKTLKSVLLDAEELENFDKLKYSEGFKISVGEYNDWQNVVFFVPPEIKLDEDSEIPHIFQRVENLNFGGKTFKDKNLSSAKFVNCGFERCVFDHVVLDEARFVNCRFKDVLMRDGSMVLTGFIKCSLVDLDTRTIDFTGSFVSDCVMENVVMD